jgi:hypothetical protein
MRRVLWITAVVVAVVVAATVSTAYILRPPPHPKPAPLGGGPVAPPPAGAYLGAWVRPAELTQKGRLAAVDDWEKLLGRRMDVVNTYRRFDENFFNASDDAIAARGTTLMLSWAGADTREVVAGLHDDVIKARADELRTFGKPVLLRYRWEMDRPGLRASMWSGPDYIAAWKHVRAIFAEEGATNASWVWCPTGEGYNGGYAQAFYPGDAQVDWVCADIYAGAKFTSFGNLASGFLAFSAQHPTRPAMVGEFGVARAWGADQRAAWLRDAGAVFRAHPQIRAAMYFESDPTDNESAKEQFELADDPKALAAFKQLAASPYFNPRPR